MNLKNKKVHHRQFGDGVVTEQTTSTVTVRFSEEFGEKKFFYPAAFESFLSLNSPSLKALMEAELLEIRERLEAEQRRREEEVERRRQEEKRALLEQKRAAAKKRTPAKKALPKPKAPSDNV